MDYKKILIDYVTAASATAGQIVYQFNDGLLEVCESEETKRFLLNLINRSDYITNYYGVCSSAYSELIDWAQESDLLLESSEGILFCIPRQAS